MILSAGAISANSTNETSADLYNRFLRENPSPFKGWKEGFVAFAEYVAKSADNCGTLQAYLSEIFTADFRFPVLWRSVINSQKQCADTMQIFFEESVASDPTNNFMTLVFCGAETDHIPDTNGNVWWYDHYQVSKNTVDPAHELNVMFRSIQICHTGSLTM